MDARWLRSPGQNSDQLVTAGLNRRFLHSHPLSRAGAVTEKTAGIIRFGGLEFSCLAAVNRTALGSNPTCRAKTHSTNSVRLRLTQVPAKHTASSDTHGLSARFSMSLACLRPDELETDMAGRPPRGGVD
jgi:hypothetical protein